MADIPNYPSNSAKTKKPETGSPEKERPPIEAVVESGVIKRKKSFGRKLGEVFVVEDTQSVVGYVVQDVLIPGAKNVIFDMIRDGFERMLWGGSSARSNRRRGGYTSYNTMYKDPRKDDRRDYRADSDRDSISRRARATHDFGELVITDRGEAEEVIDRLNDLVDNYGLATVSDLYDLLGMHANYTDQKWGWTNLATASVNPIRGGYLLDLPRPTPVE